MRARRSHRRRRKRTPPAAGLRAAIERGDCATVRRAVARRPRLVHMPAGRAADRPVHVAARAGRPRVVRMLVLDGGADPNARNARRQTPVHLCVLHRRHGTVGPLIDAGADPAAADGTGNTPLDLAMMTRDRRCVDVLLNYDMPTSVMDRAFYRAATQDNTILMNKLLNRGAHIEYVDETTGFTALLMAVKSKRVRTTQFLLEKGADPAAHDSSGWTCLHSAVYHGCPARTLMTMLQEESDRAGGGPPLRLLDRRTRDHQETALHVAARTGHADAAWTLLRAGAPADPLDRESRTPLQTALHWRHDAVARRLVYAGASVNRVPGSGGAPLRAAVARDHVPLARLMLERGSVVVDLRNDDLDRTVVHTVCETGAVDMLECLLAYAGPDALDALHAAGRARPPLLVAAAAGHAAAVDALLARGVDVNARGAGGETALHAAARAGRAALVDRLLDAGACVDARDAAAAGRRAVDVAVCAWGRGTAVAAHLVHAGRVAKAVARHDVPAVAFLLACGVTPNMTTEAHGSPLHAAVRHRRYRMMAAVLASDRCRTTVRHRGVTALDHALAAGDARAADMILLCGRDRRGRRAPAAAKDKGRQRRKTTATAVTPPPPPPPPRLSGLSRRASV